MEVILRQQTAVAKQIAQAVVNFKKTGEVRRTTAYLNARIQQATELWKTFSSNHQELYTFDEDPPESHSYIKDNVYATTEETYFNYINELEAVLERRPPPNSATAEQKSDLQLPRINLPKFDGCYSNWRSFYDLFTSLIHEDTRIPPVQKLHYLKSSLTGEAERLLKKYKIIEANYQPAWELLERRYNNRRILVNSHLKDLCNQPAIKTESAESIKQLMDHTSECLHELQALGVITTDWDILIIYIMIQRLPTETHNLWEQNLGNSQNLPTLQQFMDFLETRYRTLEAITESQPCKSSQPLHSKNSRMNILNHLSTRSSKCCLCKEPHQVYQCSKFKKMDVNQRRNLTLKEKLCYNCLSSTHTSINCPSKRKCIKCNKRHHSMLHIDNKENPRSHIGESLQESTKSFTTRESSPNEETGNSSSAKRLQNTSLNAHTNTCRHQALLATALVKAETSTGQSLTLRALIDPGSQINIVSKRASKGLHLKETPTNIQIHGLAKTKTATANKAVNFTIKSLINASFQLEIDALILKQITDFLPPSKIQVHLWEHIQGLQLADPSFIHPGKIDILLGAEVYAQILREGLSKPTIKGLPTAQNTALGWILFGQTNPLLKKGSVLTLSVENNSIENNIHQLEDQMRKFWEWENLSETRTWTSEEIQCEDFFAATHQRKKGGTYEVRLPFKDNKKPDLGNSRNVSIKRFLQLEKKLAANPNLHAEYAQCINEYLKLNHMKPLQLQDEAGTTSQTNVGHYYLPHHAVFKQSSTTKLRVVFDASARTSNGKSLNQQLLVGPTLQPKLLATLLNWRKYKYCLSADIEKMYRMIQLHPDDHQYQRIIWRDDIRKPLQEYVLTTVTFGTASAPFLAIRTMQQLAKDDQHLYPQAARAVLADSYVDDILTGADTITEAIQLQTELTNLLRGGGFKLRKWASNHSDILATIPPEDREVNFPLTFDEEDTIKALGIYWHPSYDHFSFKLQIRESHGILTKRKILSEISQLFDPLGWLAPAVISAKILIQKLWSSGCSWDEAIPANLSNEWATLKTNLQAIASLKIPRWIQLHNTMKSCQLHGFSDASTQAYAAAVYLRIEDHTGNIHVNLLIAKTRVAPIKTISLPRLELCAAVLLIKLLDTVRKDMNLLNVQSYSWTDSKITLSWIQAHPNKWKTFVANRVAEIQDKGSLNSWHYIPSKENPADPASRGINPTALLENTIWWQGPAWLSHPQSHWPQSTLEVPKDVITEAKTTQLFLSTNTEGNSLIFKFSSFHRMIRTISWCQRFIHNCKQPLIKRRTGSLTPTELQSTEDILIRVVQSAEFPEEVKLLRSHKAIPKSSKIKNLNPVLTKDGLLRVGGRITHADLQFNQRHPVILPKKHHFTNILIDAYHQRTLHGGTQLVLSTLRDKYWILDGRNTVRFRISKCVTCIRYRGQSPNQIMSNLPAARVNQSHPFSHCGLDYAGPIDLKMSKHRGSKIYKGYFCIFICLATKAIHIEAVSDLTSEAFIAAFRRFIGRRGLCTHIYSDCGTNFIGAEKLLKRELQAAVKQGNSTAADLYAKDGITWHFNPPASPHFGGLWEAGVKSIKHHLRRILGSSVLTYEELATILIQIEACLNSRPLCPIDTDSTSLEALTPGHFLIGRSLLLHPEKDITASTPNYLTRWQHIQQMVQHFWKRWSAEYLSRLQQRPKWLSQTPNLNIGDLVLVKDDKLPPSRWLLGRIIETYPGSDNNVRVASIKTTIGTTKRPINKLCPLPMDTPTI